MAAFDMNNPESVVSPGGVGFDINCGVRLVRTNLRQKDVEPIKEQLAQVRDKRKERETETETETERDKDRETERGERERERERERDRQTDRGDKGERIGQCFC